MNCGRASQSSLAPADVTDCALQQFAAKKKFYARYDLEGFDSEQTLGFAFDGEKLYTVTWQRMIGWTGKQTLKTQECPLPIQLTTTRSGRLHCSLPNLAPSMGRSLGVRDARGLIFFAYPQ